MDSIQQWLAQRQITQVEGVVPDLAGNARGKFIPVAQFLEMGDPRLPESIMAQSITGKYSEKHPVFVAPTDGDMTCAPSPIRGAGRLYH